MMASHAGGSYNVGINDEHTADAVVLKRYTGEDGTGTLLFTMEMPPAEARSLGRALVYYADMIDGTNDELDEP